MTTVKSDFRTSELVKCDTLLIGDMAIVHLSTVMQFLTGCIIMRIFNGIIVLDNQGRLEVEIGSHYQWDTGGPRLMEELNVCPLRSGESVTLISEGCLKKKWDKMVAKKGAIVKMTDGGQKPIEEIKVGDEVTVCTETDKEPQEFTICGIYEFLRPPAAPPK
jgi:hypothetical protein